MHFSIGLLYYYYGHLWGCFQFWGAKRGIRGRDHFRSIYAPYNKVNRFKSMAMTIKMETIFPYPQVEKIPKGKAKPVQAQQAEHNGSPNKKIIQNKIYIVIFQN